jgi:hypothetical protein
LASCIFLAEARRINSHTAVTVNQNRVKVFCFFFSKKKCFLPCLGTPAHLHLSHWHASHWHAAPLAQAGADRVPAGPVED